MSIYRVLIEGRGLFAGGSTGFFTSRAVSAETLDEARSIVIADLKEEWSTGVSAYLLEADALKLNVIDGWRVRLWNSSPNGGHTFFDESAIAEAAKLEAKAAKAPRGAAIWKIASSSR
jgi:hypothetical protein